jgi:putative ABC transport system substrate-binding protein
MGEGHAAVVMLSWREEVEGPAMRRREFVTVLGGATVSWPLAVSAQQPERMRRVGILTPTAATDRNAAVEFEAFKQTLQQLGWQEGRNIQFEFRFGAIEPERRRASAKELVDVSADVLFTSATPQVAALVNETRTIPIVFVNVSDPVGSGFASSLAHPGGNVTGFTNYESSLGQKWLELLKEIAPAIARVGVMFNPETAVNSGQFFFKPIEGAARLRGVDPIATPIRNAADIERALGALAATPGAGLIAIPDSTTTVHRELIAQLAIQYRLPALMNLRAFVEAGGLMSYGIYRVDQIRRAASYVDRILKGEKPADLPVQGPTRFQLVINLKTAKVLGLTVPLTLQASADDVIE